MPDIPNSSPAAGMALRYAQHSARTELARHVQHFRDCADNIQRYLDHFNACPTPNQQADEIRFALNHLSNGNALRRVDVLAEAMGELMVAAALADAAATPTAPAVAILDAARAAVDAYEERFATSHGMQGPIDGEIRGLDSALRAGGA